MEGRLRTNKIEGRLRTNETNKVTKRWVQRGTVNNNKLLACFKRGKFLTVPEHHSSLRIT